MHSHLLKFTILTFTLLISTPDSALPGQADLIWQPSEDQVDGYRVFSRQAGESYNYENPSWEGTETSCTIMDLDPSKIYHFVARAFNQSEESSDSNEATLGFTTEVVGITKLEMGRYQVTGKGKNRTKEFVITDTFSAGDTVLFRMFVADTSKGTPVINAIVTLNISGAENANLTSTSSTSEGVAEITWKTQAPKNRRSGTEPGVYAASVANVAVDGYVWDDYSAAAVLLIQ
jgi:hypothetical protein